MISVIIPSYNRRDLLLRAVNSVLNQTHADLECIVVDDASTDGTAQALAELGDSRLKIVRLERNSGACAARNRGIDLAQGDFIAFQDSDDVWHADKLEKQLIHLNDTGADVSVCGMMRFAADGARPFPAREAGFVTLPEMLRGSLCSTQCILGKAEVFRQTRFDPDMPRLQDWDMMLRASRHFRIALTPEPLVDVYLQPDSISRQPKKLLTALKRLYGKFRADICAQDDLARHWMRSVMDAADGCGESPWTATFLAIAPEFVVKPGWHADEPVTLHAANDMADSPGVHAYLTVPDAPHLLVPDAVLADFVRIHRGQIRFADGIHRAAPCGDAERDAIRTGLDCLKPRTAWDLLVPVYGAAKVAAELAGVSFNYMSRWAKALRDVDLPVRRDAVRRVAVYYHSLGEGGVQRVASQLAAIWAQMGYAVRLILERAIAPGDFPVPEGAEVRVIPALDPIFPDTARLHAAALADALDGCDCLVYHAWADPLVFADLLIARAVGCRAIVHTHSVFTMPLLERLSDRFLAQPDAYAHADALITLTDADHAYWSRLHPRVYRTCNPLPFDPVDTPVSPLRGMTVLWAGRLKAEKRPLDAIDVMARVIRRVPEARLLLAGSGDASITNDLMSRIAAQGLSGRVTLLGHVADMAAVYAQSDVLLCTSAYEGYGLTLAEAAAFGIPAVSYAMPYLPTLGDGCVQAPQQDVAAAADAVARLLVDGEKRRNLGKLARQHALAALTVDQEALWRRIFTDMQQPSAPFTPDADALMLQTLCDHAVLAKTAVTAQSGLSGALAFVPTPRTGPCRRLRKKAATFLQILLIEGFSGIRRVIREKRG